MSGLETAIRNALERSERGNPQTRARIYQSAHHALDAGLRKQGISDPVVIEQQRQKLDALIASIEAVERVADEQKPQPQPPLIPDVMAVDAAVPTGPAPVDQGLTAERDVAPDAATPGDSLDAVRPERDEAFSPASEVSAPPPARTGRDRSRKIKKPEPAAARSKATRKRRSSFLSLVLVTVTLGAAGAAGLWWLDNSGLITALVEGEAGAPATTATGANPEGLKTLGSAQGFSSDWLSVFATPADANVTARGNVTTRPVSDENGARLSVTSADAAGEALIEIPASILEALSGKTSTIAITVQGGDGKRTEFSAQCDFGTMGQCERHRFTVNDEKVDMLFKVSFDRSLAPSAPGYLAVNSDVAGTGRSINIYAIRVLPGQ